MKDELALIDSPYSNAANIARALREVGTSLLVTRDPAAIATASKIVLPGVGNFAAAMGWLESTHISTAIRDGVAKGASLLGICVGHQLLFETSEEIAASVWRRPPSADVPPPAAEGGHLYTVRGLALLRGEVRRFDGPLPVPQIGWNRVDARGPLFDGIATGTAFYFVNSYAVRNASAEIASAEYNGAFTAAVQQDRVFGVQFHPEKSSTAGLRVLRNFVTCN